MKGWATVAAALLGMTGQAVAGPCTPGDIVVKFATVVSATDNPKGIAARIFADRVNHEMAGKLCVLHSLLPILFASNRSAFYFA